MSTPIGGANDPKANRIDQKTFEANLQQVGGQREHLKKKEEEKLLSTQMAPTDRLDGSVFTSMPKAQQMTPPTQGAQQLAAGLPARPMMPANTPATFMGGPPPTPGYGTQGTSTPMPGAQPGAMPMGGAGAPGAPPSGVPAPPTNYTGAAQQSQMVQNDLQNANQIYWQMTADRMKWQQQIMAILADTQTAIFNIWQNVLINRMQVQDKVRAAWEKAILGVD